MVYSHDQQIPRPFFPTLLGQYPLPDSRPNPKVGWLQPRADSLRPYGYWHDRIDHGDVPGATLDLQQAHKGSVDWLSPIDAAFVCLP
jgi:hypothetical protein